MIQSGKPSEIPPKRSDPCSGFKVGALGFGLDKDHLSDTCDLGPGHTQPFGIRFKCDAMLLNQEITVAIDFRAGSGALRYRGTQSVFVV
jgi:hypothetical protein